MVPLDDSEVDDVAVEVAAGRDRVYVAAGHHGRVGVVARPGTDDVADLVDDDPQPEITHPAHDEIATATILVGEREPGTTAAFDGPDLRERVEAGAQARQRDLAAAAGRPAHQTSRLIPGGRAAGPARAGTLRR